MCGFFGILLNDERQQPDSDDLQHTARLLRHRGPDHQGVHVGDGIGLVHTRLSLLDLAARSHQPFWDETGRYALLYNGEVYNFRELREKLERRPVLMKTY